MAQQPSSVAMDRLVPHAEHGDNFRGKILVDWCFHELGLLAVDLLDRLNICIRDLVRTDPYGWSIFLVKLMKRLGPISGQIDEYQPLPCDSRQKWSWNVTQWREKYISNGLIHHISFTGTSILSGIWID